MKTPAILALTLLVALAAACFSAPPPEKPVTIQWLGHACFRLTSSQGVRIVTDPFPAVIGYPLTHPTADILLVSHEHSDHNAVETVRGKPATVRFGGRAGAATACGIAFKGIQAHHYPADRLDLAKRGTVTIFTFQVDGIRFCHLADLGRLLTPAQVRAIGPVDVLMIPTGGYYTIGPAQAHQVIAQLRPRVAIPMHYRTRVMPSNFDALAALPEFLAGRPEVKRIPGDTVTLTKAGLPAKTTLYAFMKYTK